MAIPSRPVIKLGAVGPWITGNVQWNCSYGIWTPHLGPIFLTKNNVPIFQNATVWFELKTTQKIDFGTHTFFLGEIIDCKTLNPDDRVAYMGDTRMKYGGVPRGGH